MDPWTPTGLTIDSHVTGEHLDLCTSQRTGPDGRFRFLWTLWPHKRGPNEHHHTEESERLEVVSGTLHVWLDGVLRVCGPGDVVDVPSGTRHRFLNPTDVPTVVRVAFTGTKMEDTFVPPAIAIRDGTKELTAFARMTVFLAQHRPTRPSARWEVLMVRAAAALFRLVGIRAHDPVLGWDGP